MRSHNSFFLDSSATLGTTSGKIMESFPHSLRIFIRLICFFPIKLNRDISQNYYYLKCQPSGIKQAAGKNMESHNSEETNMESPISMSKTITCIRLNLIIRLQLKRSGLTLHQVD